jgi:Tfp pilus assembly protein PilZ
VDKRITRRKIKRLNIIFSDGTEEHPGTSSDFSTNGLFIRTRKPFKPGTAVTMLLEISVTQKIALSGVVIRAIKTGLRDFKNGMGIKLDSIPHEYEVFLSDLLT